MKLITVQKIGYNHPSQANWSYEVYSLGLLDTEKQYNMAYTLKGAFTSDNQFMGEVQEKLKMDIPYFILKSVYTGRNNNIVGVSQMINTGSEELLTIIKDFLTSK